MTAYENGANLERRVANQLVKDGYGAIRVAGSRGPVDVFAFKPGETLAIQVKADGRLDPDPWNELVALARRLGHVPILAERVGRKLVFWELTGPRAAYVRDLPRKPWTADRVAA